MFLIGSPFFYCAIVCVVVYGAVLRRFRNRWIMLIQWNVTVLLLLLSFADTGLNSLMRPEFNDFRVDNVYYHHGMRPMMRSVGKWEPGNEDTIYPVKTNSLGFRDASARTVPLQTDATRIVILGDSFTEGVGFPFEKTFAGRIHDHFAPQGFSVLNAAVVSYSPKLYYLKMRYFIEKRGLEFDHLYLFLDISDIQDEIVYKYFAPEEASSGPLHSISRFFFKHSYIYMLIKMRYYYTQRNPRHERSDYWGGLAHFYALKSRWTLDEKEFKRWGREGLDSALKYMNKLHTLLSKHNIELHLAIYPWPEQILHRQLESIHTETWKTFCRERNIEFINMFPIFINERDPNDIIRDYFINGDVHWNAAGHKHVANHVIPLIEQELTK